MLAATGMIVQDVYTFPGVTKTFGFTLPCNNCGILCTVYGVAPLFASSPQLLSA